MDTSLGGKDNNLATNVTFIESKGVTKLRFSRLRTVQEAFDTNFTSSTFTVYYAFSNEYNLTSHQLNAGKAVKIQFQTCSKFQYKIGFDNVHRFITTWIS